MSRHDNINVGRRQFFKAGAALTATAVASRSLAATGSQAPAEERSLYELVTVELRPVKDTEAVQRIAKAPPLVDGGAALLGFWWTEIGAMNQLISLWSRPDAATSRNNLEAEDGEWLRSIADLVVNVDVERFRSLPFFPEIRPGTYGNVYELRTYRLKPDGLQPTIDRWQAAVPERIKLSPIVAAMYAVGGSLQTFVHIWAYPSLDERQRLRKLAIERGIWPPRGAPDFILRQQNSIMLAAPFSPMR